METRGEIRPLTGLRGVAASVVMIYHFFYGDFRAAPLIGRGYLAVDLFFVLSGFVLAMSSGRQFTGRPSPAAYGRFLIKRIARVYPLLVAVIAFALAKYLLDPGGTVRPAYAGYGPRDLAANLAMIQAWGLGFVGMPAATWSVSAEFFAYLTFPLLAFIALNRRGIFPALMVAASVLGAWLCAVSPYGTVGPLDVTSRDNPFALVRCLSGFCLGLVTYRLAGEGCIRRLLASGWATALVLCGLCGAVLRGHDLAVLLLYPALVANLSYDGPLAGRLFGNAIVHRIGVISYSVYLIHPQLAPAARRIGRVLVAHLGAGGDWLALAIYVAVVYAAASLCFRWIEGPGRKLVGAAAAPGRLVAAMRGGWPRRGRAGGARASSP